MLIWSPANGNICDLVIFGYFFLIFSVIYIVSDISIILWGWSCLVNFFFILFGLSSFLSRTSVYK